MTDGDFPTCVRQIGSQKPQIISEFLLYSSFFLSQKTSFIAHLLTLGNKFENTYYAHTKPRPPTVFPRPTALAWLCPKDKNISLLCGASRPRKFCRNLTAISLGCRFFRYADPHRREIIFRRPQRDLDEIENRELPTRSPYRRD